MNKRQIVASLNKIANQLDTAKLYTEANTVTKVMSRIAMDENDEYGSMEDMGYCPECQELSLIDGKCEQCGYGEDEEEDGSMNRHKDMYEGFDEVSNMIDPMGTSNKPDDLLSHHAKDYMNPGHEDIENVFDELDHMLDSYMLNPKQKQRYEEIKNRIMNNFR